MSPRTLAVIIFGLLVVSPISEAKKRCKPLLEKLHNIQSMQRHGYSAKRGLSLRDREDKAREKWWQCEKGKAPSAKKKKVANKKSKQKVTTTQVSYKKINAGTPFKTSSNIVIKSKYQGNKKRAWLAFYQLPDGCHRPKSIQRFAFCSEDKRAQRQSFESWYID